MPSISGNSTELEHCFTRDGYVHIPSILTIDEIAEIRERLHYLFNIVEHVCAPHRAMRLTPWLLFKEPLLYTLPFREKIVSALKSILEPNYTMFPNFVAAKNQLLITSGKGNYAGWHWDAYNEGKHSYLSNPEFRFVNCGLYLQDNTADLGGGIDVVKGRHKWPIRTGKVELDFMFKNIADLFSAKLFGKRVPLKAGDALIFHTCLPHRSTIPGKVMPTISAEDLAHNQFSGVSPENTKFTFYWKACQTPFAKNFMENIVRHAQKLELANSERCLFADTEFTSMNFPEDFPDKFVEIVEASEARFTTLDPATIEAMRNAYAQHSGYQYQLEYSKLLNHNDSGTNTVSNLNGTAIEN